MNLEIKKDLASNWFKLFKMHFVMIFANLKKIKFNLNQQLGKEMPKKMKVVENIEYFKMEKFLKKLV